MTRPPGRSPATARVRDAAPPDAQYDVRLDPDDRPGPVRSRSTATPTPGGQPTAWGTLCWLRADIDFQVALLTGFGLEAMDDLREGRRST